MAKKQVKQAKRKLARKPRSHPPLAANQQEMSTMQIWLWLIGGMVLLAIVFALIDIIKARYWS
jgi:hypothetical protein